MKLRFSGRSALLPATVAAVARVAYDLLVDDPYIRNGAWLCPIIGAAVAMPVILAARALYQRCVRNEHRFVQKPVDILLAMLILYDAASAIGMAAFSAGCIAFEHIAAPLLAIPVILVAARAIWLGGDSIGAAARIGTFVVGALIALVVALQLGYFRPGWLSPILGFGARSLWTGGLRAAGFYGMLYASAIAATRPNELLDLKSIVLNVSIAALATSALIVLCLMLAPALIGAGASQAQRLDNLLNNGRAALYLQLPMTVIWFIALLNLICCECVAGASLIQGAFSFRRNWISGIAALLFVAAFSLRATLGIASAETASWQLYLIALAVFPSALLSAILKGGDAG